jgi:hypothetical protein
MQVLRCPQAAAEPPRPAATHEAPKKTHDVHKRPPPAPSALERFGGVHAERAKRVAQGVPAGRIALRPMFWMTRDRSGAMVALGGRF